MALSSGLARTIYARTLGSINFAGGNVSAEDLAQHARFLQQQHDPTRQYQYFDFLNVLRQALRDWEAARTHANAGPLWTIHDRLPTDPTITSQTDLYRARVLVTITLPDGTSRSDLVVVDDSGAATPAELVARAIAMVQRDLGTNLVPPTFRAAAQRNPTWSGTLNTIGRAPGS